MSDDILPYLRNLQLIGTCAQCLWDDLTHKIDGNDPKGSKSLQSWNIPSPHHEKANFNRRIIKPISMSQKSDQAISMSQKSDCEYSDCVIITSPNKRIAVTEIRTAAHDGTSRSKKSGRVSMATEFASKRVTRRRWCRRMTSETWRTLKGKWDVYNEDTYKE